MLRGWKELSGPQGGLSNDLMGGSQGLWETSLWDGMGEGAISRKMWAQWDRGPLPGFEEEGRKGLEGETGPQEEGIRWDPNCWLVPSVFMLTHDPPLAGEAASSLSPPPDPLPPSGLSHWAELLGKDFPFPDLI